MKLLHLEDNESDAELVAAVLQREWPTCHITRLCTAREFEAALQLEAFDLILSDYSMPAFDGLAALDMVRKLCPETPFVFLSGTIGEERALQALRQGATDYVLKDSPARLLAAVRGAMQQAQREMARRRAEESLRKSREQFQQIAETIEDFIVLMDEHGRCLYANPAFSKLMRSDERPVGASIFDCVHPEDLALVRTMVRNGSRSSQQSDVEYRIVFPSGETRHIEARVGVPRHARDEVPTLLLAGRDVTQRKVAEEKLHEQASLLGKARDAICLINLQFAITHWNASAERIYGRPAPEVMGRNIRELLFGSQAARFDTAFALTMAHGEWRGEFRLRRDDGRDLVVDSSWSLVNDAQGRPKSILCIDADVTARKQLEVELQRAQRTESLGMLASGIAHDLNNILSPILMSVGLLRPLAIKPEDQIVVDTLETSATHGTDLVRQILLFARGVEGQRTEVQLGKLLDELEGFLKTTVRRGIDLYLDHDDNLWPVSADATQIKQVLVNLCVNARDAMGESGTIRVNATNVRVAAGSRRGFHGEIPAGSYVRLSVSDTGTGIPPEIMEKIFDPFFTTKEVGKGTGLGLATIAGIIQKHEGAIEVESVAGQGTTFHIYLPSLAPVAPARPLSTAADAPRGNGETILVIDDEDGIRFIAEKILTSHGYEVCVAADGQTGIEEVERQGDRIRLVMCDQVMPGLKGPEVLDRIHRLAPQIRMIAMSGMLEGSSNPGGAGGRHAWTLAKPLRAEALLRMVRHALDSPAPAEA